MGYQQQGMRYDRCAVVVATTTEHVWGSLIVCTSWRILRLPIRFVGQQPALQKSYMLSKSYRTEDIPHFVHMYVDRASVLLCWLVLANVETGLHALVTSVTTSPNKDLSRDISCRQLETCVRGVPGASKQLRLSTSMHMHAAVPSRV